MKNLKSNIILIVAILIIGLIGIIGCTSTTKTEETHTVKVYSAYDGKLIRVYENVSNVNGSEGYVYFNCNGQISIMGAIVEVN